MYVKFKNSYTKVEDITEAAEERLKIYNIIGNNVLGFQ
jgi:hypothetical protein